MSVDPIVVAKTLEGKFRFLGKGKGASSRNFEYAEIEFSLPEGWSMTNRWRHGHFERWVECAKEGHGVVITLRRERKEE